MTNLPGLLGFQATRMRRREERRKQSSVDVQFTDSLHRAPAPLSDLAGLFLTGCFLLVLSGLTGECMLKLSYPFSPCNSHCSLSFALWAYAVYLRCRRYYFSWRLMSFPILLVKIRLTCVVVRVWMALCWHVQQFYSEECSVAFVDFPPVVCI